MSSSWFPSSATSDGSTKSGDVASVVTVAIAGSKSRMAPEPPAAPPSAITTLPSTLATRPHGSASGAPDTRGVTAPLSGSTRKTAPSSPPLSRLRSVTMRVPSTACAIPAGSTSGGPLASCIFAPFSALMRKISAAGVSMPMSATNRRPPGPKVTPQGSASWPPAATSVTSARCGIDAEDRLRALVGDDQAAGAVEHHVRWADERRARGHHRALAGGEVHAKDRAGAAGTCRPVGDVHVARRSGGRARPRGEQREDGENACDPASHDHDDR